MRYVVVSGLICVVLETFGVPVAGAQELAAARGEAAFERAGWADGPAGFLATKNELHEWEELTTDAARRRFIELFWARRNPDPTQSFNQFKAQFDSRVRYADDNFSHHDVRGALTDRGRVLILMGPPHQAEHRGPTETVQAMGGVDSAAPNRATDEVRAAAEMWVYDPARLPAGFKAKGSQLLYVFYEEKAETNEFILDRSHPEATMGMRALARAPEVHLLHPDLVEVPRPVSVPGGRPASSEHLAWLEGPAPWSDRARLLAEAGVADAGHRPIWLHLELPPEAPRLDLLAGRVRSADGELLSTFEIAGRQLGRGDRAAYHVTLPLAQGSYRVDVVGAATGAPQVSLSSELEVPTAPVEGSWLSPIWVGVETVLEDQVALGSAFCFGRLHLIPLLSGSHVQRQSELTFVGFAVRPGLDGQAAPRFTAQIVLSRGGRRLGRPLDMPVEAARLADDLYVYLNAIDLSALPEPGSYGLAFTVTDGIAQVTAEREIEITVVD